MPLLLKQAPDWNKQRLTLKLGKCLLSLAEHGLVIPPRLTAYHYQSQSISTPVRTTAPLGYTNKHSTGHNTRLDRPLGNRFGSPAYAREELIAELASVLACYRLRIGYELEQHSAYLKSWASALKEGGAKELFKVLSLARQSADLIAPEPAEVDEPMASYSLKI